MPAGEDNNNQEVESKRPTRALYVPCGNSPFAGWMRVLRSPSEGGYIARRLLPVAFIVPVALGYVSLNADKAQVTSIPTVVFIVLVLIAVFSYLIMRMAMAVETASNEREKSLQTIKLLYEQLEDMRDKAVEAARVKSDFLANMSHEIRTPMNAVIGCADLLGRTALATEQKRFVDIINSSGNHLLEIIDDILLLSKIEAGKLDLDKVEIDLTELAEGCVDVVSEKAREKQLSLTTFVSPDIDTKVIGDAHSSRQILINLLSNSVKFTSVGSVSLRVTTEEADAENIVVRFSVIDTGIGITPEALKKLFQPFTQADTSITRKFGGTGLGLTICQKLTELMGGTMNVESRVGIGSIFSFALPFQKSTQRAKKNYDLAGTRLLVIGIPMNEFEVIRSYCERWQVQIDYSPNIEAAMTMVLTASSSGNSERTHHMILCDAAVHGVQDFAKSLPSLNATPARLVLLAEPDQLSAIEREQKWQFHAVICRSLRQSDILDQLMIAAFPDLQKVSASPTNEVARRSNKERPAARKSILLVEDNRINQEVTRYQLQDMGFTCVVCSDGKEALNELTKHRFPLVLMDCQMPIMDGFEATGKLREIEQDASFRTPVIAMTANAMEGDADRCLDAGMDDYISKPVTVERLRAIIAKWYLVDLDNEEDAPVSGEQPLTLKDLMEPLESSFGREAAIRLLDVFDKQIPDYIERFERALEERNSKELKSAAHTLRGSCLALDLTKLITITRTIESSCTDFIVCTNEVGKLTDELQAISEILKEVLEPSPQALCSKSIKIAVVEDHPVTREAIISILSQMQDFEIVGDCGDGIEALELIASKAPDVVIFDIDLPGMSGIEAVVRAKSFMPNLKTIMLTAHDSDAELFSAFSAGADGYALKHFFNKRQLELAIRTVHMGNCWMDRALAQRVLEAATNAKNMSLEGKLSVEIDDLLKRLVTGMASSDVACTFEASYLPSLHRLNQAKLQDEDSPTGP